ncbi:MAG: hypothetical protein ACE5NG_18545 [bacterium]
MSTGAADASSLVNVLQGFEFTNSASPADAVIQHSTLLESMFFLLHTISHQDFVVDYTNRKTVVPETEELIPEHKSLGIDVHQESCAWALGSGNAFVILNHEITNARNQPIWTAGQSRFSTNNNCFSGWWDSCVVGYPCGFSKLNIT